MAGSGFQFHKAKSAGAGPTEKVKGLASTQYARGDALVVTAGTGTKASATSKITHIVEAMYTRDDLNRPATELLTTAKDEPLFCIPVAGGNIILRSDLRGDAAPPINGTACNSNSTTTELKVTAAGSTNDYNDGQCYVPELDEQRLITADSVSGGVHTFTVTPAFRRAPTTGDTVIAVPFSKGATAVKLNATTPHQCISTAVADKTGGHVKIEDVDLKNLIVYTSHPDQE